MTPLASTPGEAARLARLHELLVLDSEREPLFDSLVRLASEICQSPMALITLVDADRQWFKASVGMGDLTETPRELAFCAHTIQGDGLMQVCDAHDDARFAGNPLVTGAPGVRFYAGAPLILPSGERVGTLCVIDTHARRLDEHQCRQLVALAGLATQGLTMRRDLLARALSVRTAYERALATSEAELADLYARAPCGYYSLDAEGRFARINDTALGWLGCTRDDALGKLGIVDFLDADGREYFHQRFPRLEVDGQVMDIEYDLVGRAGRRRHVIGSTSAVHGTDGRFAMTRTVIHDISDLHRAREHLRRLGAEQQAIIDTDLVAIVKLKDRTVAWANKGAEKMFGYALREVVGQSSRLFYIDEASYQAFGEAAYPLLQAGGMHRCQLQMRRSDGASMWIDMRITAFAARPGEMLCVLVDISASKRAEEVRIRALALEAENRQLVESARVKDVFLSNMSHELYTPLNAIIGYSHLLGSGAVPWDSPKFARYLGDIAASGHQLLGQVKSVLAFTDAESARFDLRPQHVQLRAVLDGAVDIAQAEWRARSVAVTVEMDAPLTLEIDEMRLAQVVSHYLSNAIRFSHPGGRVTLRARPLGAHEFRVDVEDRGIGIAPADLPRLFMPFSQLSEGLSKTHQGAGLSLALTRRLVEAQGGTVGVVSTPGAGSVFSFTLPRVQGSVA